MSTLPQPYVDHTALKFNQASIITLLTLAFVLDQTWLVAFVGLVMLVGTLYPPASLFKQLYAQVLKPAGMLKPDPVPDEPQPHLFAQGLGAIFLGFATLFFLASQPVIAWILTAVVIVLAAVNLFLGFCLGCYVFYQFDRRGIRLQFPQWS